MSYGHLRDDCLYAGPNLGIEYGKPLPLPYLFAHFEGARVRHVLTRDHTVYLAPHVYHTSGMSHTCLYSPAAGSMVICCWEDNRWSGGK